MLPSQCVARLVCACVAAVLLHSCTGKPHARAGAAVHIDTAVLLSQVSPGYKCYNIDASPNRGFLWRNLSSPNLLQLAKALPAGHLRFGGSGNDALWCEPPLLE